MRESLGKNIAAIREDELWGGKSRSIDEGEIFRVNLMDTNSLERPGRTSGLREEKTVLSCTGC